MFMTRSIKTERCFPSHSLTLRPWIAAVPVAPPGAASSYVEELWSPDLGLQAKNRRLKQTINRQRQFQRKAREPFSLKRGLNSVLALVQAEHHLWFRR
jgi:hypothetical protein